MAPNLKLLFPKYFSITYGISVQFFLIDPSFLTGWAQKARILIGGNSPTANLMLQFLCLSELPHREKENPLWKRMWNFGKTNHASWFWQHFVEATLWGMESNASKETWPLGHATSLLTKYVGLVLTAWFSLKWYKVLSHPCPLSTHYPKGGFGRESNYELYYQQL